MPLRKEPKETVVYPASKRKAPPFKPPRPAKAPRPSSTDSQTSQPRPTGVTATAATRSDRSLPDSEIGRSDEEIRPSISLDHEDDASSDDEDALPSNPLHAPRQQPMRKKPVPPRRAPPSKRTAPRQPSSSPVQSEQSSPQLSPQPGRSADTDAVMPSQSDEIPTVPQPLLIRLLHEHFTDKRTKIDKHAIQVLQKYIEIFVREAIARSAKQKQVDAEKAGRLLHETDASWLELDDLEKVAAGLVLDF